MSGENYANYYVEALIKMMNEAHLKIVGHQTTIRLNEETIQGLSREIESLNSQDAHYEKVVGDLRNELTDALNKVGEYKSQIISLEASLATTKTSTENELNIARSELQHLETFKNQLTEARKDQQEKQVKIDNLVQEISTLKSDITNKQNKIFDLNNHIKNNEAEKFHINVSLNQTKDVINKLESEIAELKKPKDVAVKKVDEKKPEVVKDVKKQKPKKTKEVSIVRDGGNF